MIALDTNVLARFLVRDDEEQALRAKAVVDRLHDNDERGYVSDIVLCELMWVLSRSYKFKRRQIVDALSQIVVAKQLSFNSIDDVLRALTAYDHGECDFADYLIREHAKTADCTSIATFDKGLLREDMFVSP